MPDTPFEAANRFRKAGVKIATATKKGEREAALLIKTTVESLAPTHLRGVGQSGANIGVIVRPSAGLGTLVKGVGPFQLIEYDTVEHAIHAEKVLTLRFPSGEFRTGPVEHPGTKGKHPFGKGVETVRPAVPGIIQTQVNAALLETFAGGLL